MYCSNTEIPDQCEKELIYPSHEEYCDLKPGEDLRQLPAWDGVPSYDIVEEDGKTYVELPYLGIIKKINRENPMVRYDPKDKRDYVIIGAGAVGITAAEHLRRNGYTGKIKMINPE